MLMFLLSAIKHVLYGSPLKYSCLGFSVRDAEIEFQKSIEPVRVNYIY